MTSCLPLVKDIVDIVQGVTIILVTIFTAHRRQPIVC